MCYLLFACAKLHRACSHKLACALCVNAVGVVTELKDMGVINDSTHLAGASCGAIIVSCVNAGMDLHGLVDKLLEVRGTAGVGTAPSDPWPGYSATARVCSGIALLVLKCGLWLHGAACAVRRRLPNSRHCRASALRH